jgi:hypothetical protein
MLWCPFFLTYLWTHVTKRWQRFFKLMINNWSPHQFHLLLMWVRKYNTHTPNLFQYKKTKIAANDKHLGLIHV